MVSKNRRHFLQRSRFGHFGGFEYSENFQDL